MHRGPPPMAHPRPEPIDREKTCPLLLRVFTKVGGHHLNEEFSERGKEPKDEVQIYTWKDATLQELINRRFYILKDTVTGEDMDRGWGRGKEQRENAVGSYLYDKTL
ncbi:hypothetical protein VPH35_064684 [Triticum aestivum]